MVTYINWFHDPFNGKLISISTGNYNNPKLSSGTEGSGLGEERLLRTGASTGDPYSYVIKVKFSFIILYNLALGGLIIFWLHTVRINCTCVALLPFYLLI